MTSYGRLFGGITRAATLAWYFSQIVMFFFFFFKQKTAYEIGTGDWSSDVCSSDLNNISGGSLPEILFDLLTNLRNVRKRAGWSCNKTIS